ncbi:DNA helicase mcm9 [Polyrhizophydium stewartii]|uniref:DNA helicase n=1 Tax=Polyrhizophydium stewartii TaxID=2732419 RepID=A0ABR4N597_9FUNG
MDDDDWRVQSGLAFAAVHGGGGGGADPHGSDSDNDDLGLRAEAAEAAAARERAAAAAAAAAAGAAGAGADSAGADSAAGEPGAQDPGTTQRISRARVPDILEQLTADLAAMCHDAIVDMLAQSDVHAHYSIELSLVDYIEVNAFLSGLLVREPHKMIPLLDRALLEAQARIRENSGAHMAQHLRIKPNCHVRVSRPNDCEELKRARVPRCSDIGRLVFFKGTVIRTGRVKMLETLKIFQCVTCGGCFRVPYDRELFNAVPKPVRCAAGEQSGILSRTCDGTKFVEIPNEEANLSSICKDYQEIKVQEQVTKLAMGTIPRSIAVILEDDLVDTCKAGDDVWVTGTVMRRWRSLALNERCDIEIAIFANNIRLNNQNQTNALLTDETKDWFEAFWSSHRAQGKEISARNRIVQSFCPKVFGLYTVKLAVLLVLVGGVPKYENGLKIRGDSHLLLVGDPGTGKSQFLRYAAQLSARSVLTTGIGSTNAGLTVTAVRDSGEWQLEAGALVLADRGLCCIDEFGSIREADKAAIHEAMEQQTISVAKAGMVCKLNTRCSILASTNPKGKYDPKQGIEVNIALASPLLSRFDIILLLLDTQNQEWDEVVSSFILGTETSSKPIHEVTGNLWDLERMQAYLCYTRERYSPKLTEDANTVLKKYYQLQRSSDLRQSARTTIRLLESLIRLAQAHARLMCQDAVLVRDSVIAVGLVESSLHTLSLLGAGSTLHAPFPENPEEDYLDMEATILDRLGLRHLITDPSRKPKPNGLDGYPLSQISRATVHSETVLGDALDSRGLLASDPMQADPDAPRFPNGGGGFDDEIEVDPLLMQLEQEQATHPLASQPSQPSQPLPWTPSPPRHEEQLVDQERAPLFDNSGKQANENLDMNLAQAVPRQGLARHLKEFDSAVPIDAAVAQSGGDEQSRLIPADALDVSPAGEGDAGSMPKDAAIPGSSFDVEPAVLDPTAMEVATELPPQVDLGDMLAAVGDLDEVAPAAMLPPGFDCDPDFATSPSRPARTTTRTEAPSDTLDLPRPSWFASQQPENEQLQPPRSAQSLSQAQSSQPLQAAIQKPSSGPMLFKRFRPAATPSLPSQQAPAQRSNSADSARSLQDGVPTPGFQAKDTEDESVHHKQPGPRPAGYGGLSGGTESLSTILVDALAAAPDATPMRQSERAMPLFSDSPFQTPAPARSAAPRFASTAAVAGILRDGGVDALLSGTDASASSAVATAAGQATPASNRLGYDSESVDLFGLDTPVAKPAASAAALAAAAAKRPAGTGAGTKLGMAPIRSVSAPAAEIADQPPFRRTLSLGDGLAGAAGSEQTATDALGNEAAALAPTNLDPVPAARAITGGAAAALSLANRKRKRFK